MTNIIIANSKSWFELHDTSDQLEGFNFFHVQNQRSLEIAAEQLSPAFIFAPHWNERIPMELINRVTTVIFHTAPLPFGRGGSPIQNLLKLGYKESPVNALLAAQDLDAGPILCSKNVSLEGNLDDIFSRLNVSVNSLIRQILIDRPEPSEQVGEVTIFRRRRPEDSELNLAKINLEQLYDQIRMVDGLDYPRAYLDVDKYRLVFANAHIEDSRVVAQVSFEKLENHLKPKSGNS